MVPCTAVVELARCGELAGDGRALHSGRDSEQRLRARGRRRRRKWRGGAHLQSRAYTAPAGCSGGGRGGAGAAAHVGAAAQWVGAAARSGGAERDVRLGIGDWGF